ncbi:uncharacterized protein EV154DRAFT_496853 [Mucor mucedo]|uniref:uncharacterized protein n=1 Tax=Mucor mucedo TaxID=29922 RepID=UPI0022210520|nr:uncharacterized protein EV154DRAFT_496853 [Mucor mucedo]KAI7895069.1 hypothetical protein EV154DRAFT_496853 [Mucor mucedo]
MLKLISIYSNLHGSNSMRADMRYSANIKDAVEYDFLIFESRGLFKMSLKLQFMINRFILNKINNSVVYGVVGPDHDRQYDIYQMDLVSPKTYLMIKIRSFFVPRMVCDFNVAGNTIPALVQLKTLVTVQVDVARQNWDSQEKLHWIEYPEITPYET